jgi:hypothetical protein
MATLAQNLLLMRYVEYRGEFHRILSLLKVRDSDFDPSIRRYMITSEGLRILAPVAPDSVWSASPWASVPGSRQPTSAPQIWS